jgi:IS4 transposase
VSTPNGWRVVDQDHREKYTGRGTFEPVITVYYETASGTRGSVDFPEAQYNMEAVVTRINELVGRIHDVANLNGI